MSLTRIEVRESVDSLHSVFILRRSQARGLAEGLSPVQKNKADPVVPRSASCTRAVETLVTTDFDDVFGCRAFEALDDIELHLLTFG